MRLSLVLALTAAALMALAPRAHAQTVRIFLDTDTLSVGARQMLTVTIRHVGDHAPIFPGDVPAQNIPPGAMGLAGDLELLERRSNGARLLGDGSQIDSVRYEIATFAVDTAFVSARVGLASLRDTTWFTAGLDVPVRSVVPQDAEDIQDLAPLVEFPRAIWPWLLAIAAIGFALWWFVFREREEAMTDTLQEPEEPSEPPFDEAMRRLRVLSADELEDPSMKPYFVELSDIVRTYVARKTDVPALELTTSELLAALAERPSVKTDRVSEVSEVLQAADLVKFADHRPPVGRARQALTAARLSIEHTESDFAPEPVEDGVAIEHGAAVEHGAAIGHGAAIEPAPDADRPVGQDSPWSPEGNA